MPHAGFGAAITVRQELLQQFTRVMHHENQLSHHVALKQQGVEVDLFLDVPTVTCAAANQGRLAFAIRGWGPLRMPDPLGGAPVQRDVLVTATVTVRPVLALANQSLTFKVDGQTATLAALDVVSIGGGDLPAWAAAVLKGAAVHTAVRDGLRAQLSAMTKFAPPFSLRFLGPVAAAATPIVKSKVVDGALLIGLDVDLGTTRTAGVDANLADRSAGHHIGMWMSPQALETVVGPARASVAARVAAAGATLDRLTFSLGEGLIAVSGRASVPNAGSVTFSMDLTAMTVVPEKTVRWVDEDGQRQTKVYPARQELWFRPDNVKVDVQRAWWVYVAQVILGALTLGLAAIVVESIVGWIRNETYNGIKTGSARTVTGRVHQFTLEGTEEPVVTMTIRTWELHANGIFTGVDMGIAFPDDATVTGPSWVAIEEAAGASLRYAVTMPYDVHPADQRVTVAWALRRRDTNQLVRIQTAAGAAGRTFDVSGVPELLQATDFAVECRVFRPLGPRIESLWFGTAGLHVFDRVDRSRPYVRWAHVVKTPTVEVEPDGSRTLLGQHEHHRVSAIHRTAFPGRCRSVSEFSPRVALNDARNRIEYLDDLPFPRAALDANRDEVCDYCFYGGPTRTRALIP